MADDDGSSPDQVSMARVESDAEDCPRCGFAIRPGDRFCANCGLRLARVRRPVGGTKRARLEILVWLGPMFGGLLGFMIGEAIVGHLSLEPAVLIPIVGFVAGVFLGAPVLARVVDRF